ncbi:putative GATA-binding transcription factor [Tieghemostelium lacteum]|uniref:Putative GATA-binding transcription factor n=1 Tax=Tieghemostelium lacteum TaxID=361077 RepID=A0A151Z2H1_TIELA|nr:putative GATA-binding transcription factor [Tieghemostelium lacteum]|eukprot:KYQ88153.1 putative GATA-binding transcription factor [Tieghemostelium lacteum]
MNPQQYLIKKRLVDLMFSAQNIVSLINKLGNDNIEEFTNKDIQQFQTLFKSMTYIMELPPPAQEDLISEQLQIEMSKFVNTIDDIIKTLHMRVKFPTLDFDEPELESRIKSGFTSTKNITLSTTTTTTTSESSASQVFDDGSSSTNQATSGASQFSFSSFIDPRVQLSPRSQLTSIINSIPMSPPPPVSPNVSAPTSPIQSSSFINQSGFMSLDRSVNPLPIEEDPDIERYDQPTTAKKRPGRPKNENPKVLQCSKCGTTKSPEFRFKSTNPLCNACGIAFYKIKKLEAKLKGQFSISTLIEPQTTTNAETTTERSTSVDFPSYPKQKPTQRKQSKK